MHHADPSDLGRDGCLRFSRVERCRRAVHMASYKTAATRRSTQADPRVARVQVYRPRSFDSGCFLPATILYDIRRDLAYGDLADATLALLALAVLKTRLAAPLVWIFNTLGTSDLLNAFYQGSRLSLANTPGFLGACYSLGSSEFLSYSSRIFSGSDC